MVKLKICNGCKKEKPIWKSFGKEKYCKECWKRKSIAKPKNREYSNKRKKFLSIHPKCEARLPGCMSDATDVHHCYSGIDREEHFLDDNTWKAVCRNCHNIIHNVLSSEEAADLKLKITKNE